MLEKSKDAWDKFQSVTAPMESQPSEAGPAQASSRDKAPPVTRRICMCQEKLLRMGKGMRASEREGRRAMCAV